MSHRSSTIRASLVAAAGAALFAGFVASTPAQALDDGDQNIFETVKGLLGAGVGFGLGREEEQPRIDYRERAPLVLPPATTLPPPTPTVGQRNAAWPKDYDSERIRRTAEENRRARLDDGRNGAMDMRDIRNVGRLERNPTPPPPGSECQDGDLGRLCNPNEFWRIMKTTSAPADTSKDLVAGQEPPRARLTDPPKGYRTARKSQKYTFEVREEVPLGDPRAQLREEQRRAREVD